MTRTPKVDAFMLPGGWPFFTDGICAECRCEGKKHAKRFLCVECHEYLTPEEIAELYPRTFREFGKRALEELRTRPYDYLVDKCGRPFADAAIPPDRFYTREERNVIWTELGRQVMRDSYRRWLDPDDEVDVFRAPVTRLEDVVSRSLDL